MARGLNRVTLIGNLGNDPELRYMADGVALASASLAVNGTRRTPDGAREESVEWFRLVFFDRQAETISTYGGKGKPIFVEGRLQTRPYADRNGVIRTAIEVVVSQFLLLGTASPAIIPEAVETRQEPASVEIPQARVQLTPGAEEELASFVRVHNFTPEQEEHARKYAAEISKERGHSSIRVSDVQTGARRVVNGE